jgi:hypothetical protein
MTEHVAAGIALPRAFLRVGGMPVARHQLGLVLALGCERVVCIARGMEPELVAMQHVAEKAGAQFHVITGVRALAGLVTAVDELIVLSEGLLAMPGDAAALLEAGPGVLVLPAETGIPAGFERIDLNHAGAGAMRIPARLAERLADLPPDCDAASSLLRIALQAGVPQRMVPQASRDSARWTLVRTEAEAHAVEVPWIKLHTASSGVMTPGSWVARFAVRAFGPALLHAGSNANSLAAAAAALILIGLGAGWFGYITFGLILAGIGWTMRQAAALLTRVERDSLQAAQSSWPREAAFGWVFDGLLVVLLGWAMATQPWQPMLERYFPALVLVGMIRLLARAIDSRWTVWLEDRLLLTLVLAAASLSGVLGQGVYLLGAALALGGIALPRSSVLRSSQRITSA